MDDNLLRINQEELEKIAHTENGLIMNNHKIQRLPFYDVSIYFDEDIWDFEDYNPSMGKHRNIYKFEEIHPEYKPYIKQFILKYLINNSRASTISKYLGYLKKIVRFLESNYVYSCEIITEDIVVKFNEFLEHNLRSENERAHHRRLLTELILYIEYDKGIDYSNLKKMLSFNDTELLKAQIERGKTPSIPSNIFDRIVSFALKELESDTFTDREKKEACSVLLFAQIGMRILELTLLEANKIKEVECFDGTKIIPYLEFMTFKTTRMNSGTITKSFLTDKALLAYQTLEKLSEESRERNKSSYLFTANSNLPINTVTMTNMISRFMIRNAMKIGLVNNKYDGFKIITPESNKVNKVAKLEYFASLSNEDFISVPKPHQFRVAVCNELIKDGGEMSWVVEHMNHLSVEMTNHYIRKTDESDEQKEMTKDLFSGLINGEFKLIGEEAELLMKKIDDFISENKYNIRTDLEEIVDKLTEIVPIREKREGYCVKSIFGKKCKYNEFLCAFEMCPNHCTSYIFVDITYKRFIEHKKCIDYNLENRFIREATQEKNKLKRMISLYLTNELKELKYEINRQGRENIIKEHSTLEDMVDNVDEITKEVDMWMKSN